VARLPPLISRAGHPTRRPVPSSRSCHPTSPVVPRPSRSLRVCPLRSPPGIPSSDRPGPPIGPDPTHPQPTQNTVTPGLDGRPTRSGPHLPASEASRSGTRTTTRCDRPSQPTQQTDPEGQTDPKQHGRCTIGEPVRTPARWSLPSGGRGAPSPQRRRRSSADRPPLDAGAESLDTSPAAPGPSRTGRPRSLNRREGSPSAPLRPGPAGRLSRRAR